jgi:hypothetical protein
LCCRVSILCADRGSSGVNITQPHTNTHTKQKNEITLFCAHLNERCSAARRAREEEEDPHTAPLSRLADLVTFQKKKRHVFGNFCSRGRRVRVRDEPRAHLIKSAVVFTNCFETRFVLRINVKHVWGDIFCRILLGTQFIFRKGHLCRETL